jgi:hypothetical protein
VPNTFIKIQTITLAGTQANIEFTSIPQTYTDLKVVMSGRVNAASTDETCKMTFNGITTGFSNRYVYSNGSSVSSGSDTQSFVFRVPSGNATASIFGSGEVYIANYTSANHKLFSDESVTENNATQSGMIFAQNLWANTAAITSITITPLNGSFVQYSTATLYGIKSS